MSVGSMTVTEERTEVLDFSPAYYYTPASIAVQEDSDVTTVDQLNGQTIGVCAGCTYDFFLQGTLDIPGYTFESPIDVDIKGYDTDSTAIQALVSGQVDGAMSATPTLEGAIKKGQPIRLVGDPLFYEPLSVAFDKESGTRPTFQLVAAVSDIIDEMHTDGTLTDLSMQWYDTDLTVSNEGITSERGTRGRRMKGGPGEPGPRPSGRPTA